MAEEPDTQAADPRRQFGEELRSARELWNPHPLTQTALGRHIGTSKSTISRIESGAGSIPAGIPAILDQFFGTDGLFKRLADEIADQGVPVLYRRRMALEREAIEICEWSPTVVPGLLQTPEYARAVFRGGLPRCTEAEVAVSLASRLIRQNRLSGARPPSLRVILCESVVEREIGPPEVMREQLHALLRHSESPTIRIQVLSKRAKAHRLLEWPVTLLRSPAHVTSVCVETYRTAGIITDPEHVRNAASAFDDLTAEALPTRDSADLIRKHLESL
ncbi:helix-turn-helix domain-containing protein [Streptomyces sp. BI20]|uniref:helix-turn-helix domain-containing protein n=1 Tax=Streptomyces sp. BI20 TaxID=3403460 RepID=UPI003C77016B